MSTRTHVQERTKHFLFIGCDFESVELSVRCTEAEADRLVAAIKQRLTDLKYESPEVYTEPEDDDTDYVIGDDFDDPEVVEEMAALIVEDQGFLPPEDESDFLDEEED